MITIVAKLRMANRELRGMRTAIIRLISATTALFLSILGIFSILIGYHNFGLVVILMTTGLLSIAVGLPAIKTLRTMAPILQRKR